jgi:hypothetical protein
MAAAERHFTRRLAAAAKAIQSASDFDEAARNLLGLAATWTPDALGALVRQATELAALEGREVVFAEDDAPAAFAEADLSRQDFREQIDFLTQKRPKPTRAWTDAMHGEHDRSFVVAGVTDTAMLEEFQAAIIDGAKTYDIKTFGKEFDRLVETYGWSYNGGRNWRVRTIFETNIRTSYMAGRLRQMRDPDMVKIRPYWQYMHADTRVPLEPRPEHVLLDGLILLWNDPWWDRYFPPNDWKCSCGVRTLSRGDLRRMGKTGPDTAPELTTHPFTHRASGETVQLPEGIGYGWDYMPGDTWERGLVPSALTEEAGGLIHEGRHVAQIDTPSALEDLIAAAKPFKAKPLAEGLPDEDYVRAFLEPFGADIGAAVLWEDASGTKIPISDQLFQDRQGNWKVGKRNRATLTPLMAETLLDPDEIWIGVAAKTDPINPDQTELIVDRRYIRTDKETGLMVVFEIGRKWWEAITAYAPTNKKRDPDLKLLDRRRGGKLVWKRK